MKQVYSILILFFCAFQSEAQTLLAQYSFSGNALDSVGTLHGTVSGAILSTDRYNQTSSCYSFDGVNDYISIGNSNIIKPINALTVTVWFELNSTGVGTGANMISNTENSGYNLQYVSSDNTIRGNLRRNNAYAVVSTNATPYKNSGWHFATLTYDGRFTKLYLDGLLVSSNDAGANYVINHTSTITYIGSEPGAGNIIDPNYYWKGKLDEIKIYDTAMSATAIANEFDNNPHPIPNFGLKLWLKSDTGVTLNGNTVSQWNDISGNNHHATQTQNTKQPLYILSALNGKPAMQFDGSNDIMFTSPIDLATTPKATIFIVNKALDDGIAVEASSNLNSSPSGFAVYENYDYGPTGFSAIMKGNAPGPSSNYLSAFRSTSNFVNSKIAYVSYDKTQSSYLNQIKIRINGVDLNNTNGYGGTHSDNFGNDTIFIGGRGTGSFYLNGEIEEIIIYNRLLTTTERIQVENYLNQRYNVSNTLVQTKPGGGKAVKLDASNAVVTIPAPIFAAYSIESWVKFTASAANKNVMVFTNSSGPGTSWSHQIRTNSAGKFQHYTFDNSGNHVIGTTTINQNQWYHVCITAQNNGTAKLYVNGIQEGTPTSIGSLWALGTEFRIGPSTGGGAGIFNGEVDEVRIWNIALTQDQIRERMCRKIYLNDSFFNNLMLNLNFDETIGNIAYDATTNARNGTLSSTVSRVTSGASIGNKSNHNYSGVLSNTSIVHAQLGEFSAGLTSGSSSGIQLYAVESAPNSRLGIDSLSSNEGYFGVFLPNGISSTYNAKYNYYNNGGFGNENFINLYKRDHNADSSWTNSFATLNVDSNTISVTGQNTEYIIGGVVTPSVYYHDVDGDSYGSMTDSLLSYSLLIGYVTNNLDCNDNDALEFPGQVWYNDADADDYGTDSSVAQCTRPLNGFASTELLSTNGDCNDNDADIYPNYQHYEFSGNGDFSSVLISPDNGDSYTTFNFEVIYKNAKGDFPLATFPRVILDYEGNGIYNNPNDRIVFMTEDDINDTNTIDGKKYLASHNGLPTGLNWKTLIRTNPIPCGADFGPFNYPDVLVRPDLEIFANDITFSIPNPPISSPLTINATIHNVSDFAAQNFVVHVKDQYDTSLVFVDIIVPQLAPQSSTTVSWNLTTASVPSWHPIQVFIDYTNVIDESNQLDNSALRPYINGNYNLPGAIVTTANPSPAVSYQSSTYMSLTGSAHYTGTAVPLIDSSVAGATVTFTIVETGATFTTHTNSKGNYYYSFPKPLAIGVYHITGTCTDYTLTGNLSAEFEIIEPIIPVCTLADLDVRIEVNAVNIVQGDSVTGNIIVKNFGQTTSAATLLSVAQSGGTPLFSGLYNVPALAPNASYAIPIAILFNTIGQYTICGLADANYTEYECSEYNTSCVVIRVFPPLPDIVPSGGPSGTAYQCPISHMSFALANNGGVPTGPFNCRVLTKLNGNVLATHDAMVSNILPIQYSPANQTLVTIPFVPANTDVYTFEVYADFPINEIAELNELNNNSTYTLNLIECKPNFHFSTCETFKVKSNDNNYTVGSPIEIKNVLRNSGNEGYSGNIQIRYTLSSGYTIDTTFAISLNPEASMPISKIIPAPSTPGDTIKVSIDPLDIIDELNEANNSTSGNMCWEFQPAPHCNTNFWDKTHLVNQPVYLSVGLRSNYLYEADSIKVKFEVSGPGISGTINLGNAIVQNVSRTCYCPMSASLPINFAFPQTGTYTFTMTADPDNEYIECNELNNVLVRTVNVTNLPDMRILSQHISPGKLNPQPNESISMNITYENIGVSNINDNMKLKVLVNNTPLDSIYPVSGLVHNGNNTLSIPATWSSNLVGVHVIRAIIDDDNQVTETNELNNEATRAIIVGESANLYFQQLFSNSLAPFINDTIQIISRIGNSGDLACSASLQLFYVNDNLDTVQISSHSISVDAHDSISIIIPWLVLDSRTSIIARIVNSSILEYTYDDNEENFKIGEMILVTKSIPACQNNHTIGKAIVHVIGGEAPYNYFWNNGFSGDTLVAAIGSYSVIVSDQTGQTRSAMAVIDSCPNVVLNTKLFIEGYYTGTQNMTPVLLNSGIFSFPIDVDSITLELRKDTTTYPVLASCKSVLLNDGSLVGYFYSSNIIGSNCYLMIKHRSGIETWSAGPITVNSNMTYDFSSAASTVYGSNQSEVENGVWALYSGDIDQDENIDLLDLGIIEADINNFVFGYFAADINGDGNVDLLDVPTVESNITSFIFAIHP